MEKLTRLYDQEGNEYDITPDLSNYVTSDEVSTAGYTGKLVDLIQVAGDEEVIFNCNVGGQ